MSRITTCFDALKVQKRKALIPYIMAGDPTPTATVPLMHAMVAAGANIIELGLPFSDPMADGPVIALAAERALAAGTSTLQVLDMVAEFRKKDQQTPIVLMGYLNPIEIIGYQKFAELAGNAGIDGLLLVDLPPEASALLVEALTPQKIDPIFLLAPTTTDERIKHVLKAAKGYVYYVSLKGVTGSSTLDTDAVLARINHIRSMTDIAIGVGFGISDGKSAKALGQSADGVIVGSVLVKPFGEKPLQEAQALAISKLQELRAALDE